MKQSAQEFKLKLKGFKVYSIAGAATGKTYSRKDLYKICLCSGTSVIEYANRGIEINGNTLFFGSPHVPYTWQVVAGGQIGFSCLFTEDFLTAGIRAESLQQCRFFYYK